jgi:hypothetical protein
MPLPRAIGAIGVLQDTRSTHIAVFLGTRLGNLVRHVLVSQIAIS